MPNAPHALLADFPVRVRLPVQWGDMDAYDHVNNTVFFRYFETARIAYLDACGFLNAYATKQIGAILHSTDCRFRLPLVYPDDVEVGGRAVEVGEDRFTMRYRVVSLGHQAVAAEGSGIIVAYDYAAHRKTTLPPEVRERIARLERGPAS